MAFEMNKPIIKGTKKHSALLATAKASGTVDPTLGTAAGYYGESMNPDVIDYTIKQTKIEWDKKKKKKKKKKEEDTPPPEEQQEEEISLEREELGPRAEPSDKKEEETELPDKRWKPDFTKIDRKKKDAKRDRDVAIEKLELQRLKQLSVDELSDKPIEAKKDYRGGYELGTLQQGPNPDLPPAKNLVKPTVVSKEDVDLGRVVMTQDGYREANWYTKQKKEVTKTTQKKVEQKKVVEKKAEEKKVVDKKTDKSTSKSTSKTDSDKKRQDFIYKLKGPAGQKKMRDAGYKPPKKKKKKKKNKNT